MRKQNLVKVRSLPQSPGLVKTTMERWTSIDSILVQDDVIPTLINFSSDYADMLKHVNPLQQELKTLKAQAETSHIEAEKMNITIHELEDSIAEYKEEYVILITEANTIKVYILYQSNLGFFLGAFQVVLSGNTNLKEMVERLCSIILHLFQVCMERECVMWSGVCVCTCCVSCNMTIYLILVQFTSFLLFSYPLLYLPLFSLR